MAVGDWAYMGVVIAIGTKVSWELFSLSEMHSFTVVVAG